MNRLVFCCSLAMLLLGCATFEKPLPQNYTGPKAEIRDDGDYEGKEKGRLFYVDAVDGKSVESGLVLTRRATQGRGFQVLLQFARHDVAARPLRLKLVGTHVTGAPIHELASRAAGTFFSVEGEVTFTPKPDTQYIVLGKLSKEETSVWIADLDTKERVSEVVKKAK
jgi:hypothetical protein